MYLRNYGISNMRIVRVDRHFAFPGASVRGIRYARNVTERPARSRRET